MTEASKVKGCPNGCPAPFLTNFDMKAPDKIYVFQHGFHAFDPLWHFTESKEKHTESHEYIRKDIADETVEVAEDHAYFAGKEKLREALLEWAKGKKEEYEKETSREYDGCTWVLNLLIEKLESL